MKLKQLLILFYKQCDCEGGEDVVTLTLRETVVCPPVCPECDRDYDFDGEAEVWDTF